MFLEPFSLWDFIYIQTTLNTTTISKIKLIWIHFGDFISYNFSLVCKCIKWWEKLQRAMFPFGHAQPQDVHDWGWAVMWNHVKQPLTRTTQTTSHMIVPKVNWNRVVFILQITNPLLHWKLWTWYYTVGWFTGWSIQTLSHVTTPTVCP